MNNLQYSLLLASHSQMDCRSCLTAKMGACGLLRRYKSRNAPSSDPRVVLASNQCSNRLSDDTESTFCVKRRTVVQDAHKAAAKWCCSGAAFWSSEKGQTDDRFMSEESQYPIDVGPASVLLLFCVLRWSGAPAAEH
jgi:hypothetical protein